jgi:hypothetical protein
MISMASEKAKEYWLGGSWQSQGYRNRPGSTEDEIPPGRTGEALLRSDRAEVEIATSGEQPEVITTPSTFTGHHSPASRTTSAAYFPDPHILRISFPATSPASGGSYNYYDVAADEWAAFKESPSPGGWIEAVGRYHSYGKAG